MAIRAERLSAPLKALSKSALPNMETMVSNILATYDVSDETMRAHGRAWYGIARGFAQSITGRRYGLEQAAGVVAALSPRKTWAANKAAAAAALQTHSSTGTASANAIMKANLRKAQAILDGSEPYDVLGRYKTRSFFENILGDLNAVCVDSWAARIATGERVDAVAPAAYPLLVEAYRAAARMRGETPRDMQAITWCQAREDHE